MNSKRKLWTNIGSLALVAVLAVGGVIGVLSALNVQISSTFSISYTAHNVHAIITGDYADSTGTQVGNLVNKADQTTQIVFNGDEDNGTTKGFEDKNDLVIKGPEETVDIHYIVRNTGSDPFGLTMIFNSNLEQSNMQVRYSVQYWNGQDPKPEYVYNQQTLSEMYLTAAGTDNCCAVVGMQFSVVNQVQNATLNATMNFDLDSTAEAPEPGPLLESWHNAREKVFEFKHVSKQDPVYYDWDWDYNLGTKSITFDRFTSDGVYNIDGKNVIEGIESIDVQDGKIFAYKVPTGENNDEDQPLYDVYFLSKDEMRFNDETFVYHQQYREDVMGFFENHAPLEMYNESDDYGYYFRGIETLAFKSVDTTAMKSFYRFLASAPYLYNGDEDLFRGTIDISGLDFENATDISSMFGGYRGSVLDLSNLNTSAIVNMEKCFYNCGPLTTLDLRSWDTSSVTNSSGMFSGCSNLQTVYVGSGWTLGDEIFPSGCDVQHV